MISTAKPNFLWEIVYSSTKRDHFPALLKVGFFSVSESYKEGLKKPQTNANPGVVSEHNNGASMVINGDLKQQTFIGPVAKIICAVMEKSHFAISNFWGKENIG